MNEKEKESVKTLIEIQSERITMLAASFSCTALLTRVLLDVLIESSPELLKSKLVAMINDLETLGLDDEQEIEILNRWIKNVDDAMNPTDWLKQLNGKVEYDA